MTEVVEKKFVTVVFPPRGWSIKESVAFEEFVKANSPDMKRIFVKYGLIK